MPPIPSAKPPGRQTNNSLSSIPESLLIASVQSSGAKKKGSSAKKEKAEKGKAPSPASGSSGGSKLTAAGGGGGAKEPVAAKREASGGDSSGSGGEAKKQNSAAGRKKKEKSSQVFTSSLIPTLSFTETDEVLQIGMHKVLEYVKNHKDAWPFMDPVEEDIAPRYYSIIRRPMDLLKMEEKLDNEEYLRYSDFRNDFKLIVNNCRLYNGHNNEYTEMVNSLQEAFERATKKYFEQNSSDEEEMNQEYPDLNLKTSAFREKPATAPTSSANSSSSKDKEPHSPKGSGKKEGGGSSSSGKGKSSKSAVAVVKNGTDNSDSVKKKLKKTLDVPKQSSKGEKTKTFIEDESDLENEVKVHKEEEESDSVSNTVNISTSQKVHKRKGSSKDDTVKKKDNNSGKANATSGGDFPKEAAKKANKQSKNVQKNASSKLEGAEDRSAGEEDEEPTRTSPKGVKRKRKDKEKKRKKKKGDNEESGAEEPIVDHDSDAERLADDEDDVHMAVDKEAEAEVVVHSKKHKNKKILDSGKKARDKSLKKEKHKDGAAAKAKGEKHHRSAEPQTSPAKSAAEESPKKAKSSKSKSTNLETANQKGGKHKSKSKNLPPPASLDKGSEDEYLFSDYEAKEEPADGDAVGPSPAKKPKKSHSNEHKSGRHKSKWKHEDKAEKSKSKKGEVASNDVMSLSEQQQPAAPQKSSKKSSKEASSSTKKSTKSASKSTESKATKKSKRGAAAKKVEDIDQMSVSSHGEEDRFSRTSSPLGSPAFDRRDLDDTFDSLHSSENRDLSRPITPDIKDKYDLIKQRRRNAGKSSAVESVSSGSMVGNKGKGKEGRKAKLKGDEKAQSSDREDRETDTASALFDRLREEDQKKTTKQPAESPSKNNDEYDFVDDAAASGSKGAPSSTNNNSKVPAKADNKAKKAGGGQMKEPLPKPAKNGGGGGGGGNKKTNMEALELETEQTLKDINRWLEHTPRFPDYSSASNSPSRYMLEEFDAMDPNVFRRPAAVGGSSSVAASPSRKTPPGRPSDEAAKKAKESAAGRPGHPQTNSVAGGSSAAAGAPSGVNGPSASGSSTTTGSSGATVPGSKKEVVKDKRKSLKDKIYNRKKEPSRTIDRLQPGKAKGNLLSSIQNINKPEELFPLGNLAKLKEVKNSLVVKADESGPKLSLGTVLDSDRFGLMQQHNFTEDKENDDQLLAEEVKSPVAAGATTTTAAAASTEPDLVEVAQEPEGSAKPKAKDDPKVAEEKGDKSSGTPNLSAWFKAFGAPKVAKSDDEAAKEKPGDKDVGLKSPSHKDVDGGFNTPAAPRMRKASTGSTISERSSYSQDPDSPRVGMDERLGYGVNQYTTSPLGSSPISLTSPKPDDMSKANYNLNGAIKVGFYQDTTQKSSPDKSCSPRDMPTPTYPQYSQPVYSATRAYANYYNTTSPVGTAANGTATTAPAATTGGQHVAGAAQMNKTAATPANPVPFYDHYNKQPRSQESDYNSSMSPNPNSPYQQQHHSPYHQQQHSPYDAHQHAAAQVQPLAQKTAASGNNAPNSPYSQAHSPYQQHSPAQPTPQTPHLSVQQPTSPYSQSNQSSPFSQSEQMSPYHHPNSPSQAAPNQTVAAAVGQQAAKPNHEGWSPAAGPATGGAIGQGAPMQTGSAYDASRGQPADVTTANKVAAQIENRKVSPPMAHSSMPTTAAAQQQQQQQQYGQMGGQNLQPAHQNYPMYPPSLAAAHSKPYEDPQSLLMSHHNLHQSHHHHHQMRPDQGMYSAPFGNIPNISTSKAFEMFNRAATFPKSLTPAAPSATPAAGGGGEPGQGSKDVYDMNYGKSSYGNTFDMLKSSSGGGQPDLLNLGTGTASGGGPSKSAAEAHQQPPQQQAQQHHAATAAHNSSAASSSHQLQYGASSRRATDLVIPNPRASVADQPHKAASVVDAHQQQQQQQQRYDYSAMAQMASYRSSPFGAGSQQHLSSMGLDERLMGMPQHPATGYYDKSLSQNMFAAKQSAMAYGNSYGAAAGDPKAMDHPSAGQSVGQPAAVPPTAAKPKKGGGRGKKSKTATPPTEQPASQVNPMHNSHLQMNQHGHVAAAHGHAMGQGQHGGHAPSQQHHHSQEAAHHAAQQQQQQGFQSYSNLKTAIAAASTTTAPASSAADASAISLKTASMMPASAFNFGPTTSGLGLYGENSYLDDFRNPANHYYLPPTAQANDKAGGSASGAGGSGQGVGAAGVGNPATGSSAAAVAAATQSAAAYHQFLSHQPARPAYPFINSQLDASSPLYQQYFQRRQDEIRAQMMLNQGLLGPHPGAPPGAYGQPGYHHPSLGMHKPPYDTMNRPSWL